ncbi:hypothetical protein [Glycomyces artemisiae]|uniref:Uncharacterized protein n=1 Tax=Glycomyces artemisiae TaxID=1076443 RepID=A0A2T0UM86_9ACTN|nr:hypothetical protein [Glycomyces artemisiae]PRY59041.1 hypothetical protein B0I28_104197 [Glycomyces artemisiae]
MGGRKRKTPKPQRDVPGAAVVSNILKDGDTLRPAKGGDFSGKAPDAPDAPKPRPDPVPDRPDFVPGPGERPILNPPAGFKDKADFERFRDRLNQGLHDAGYDDAKVMLQGSATDGVSHNPAKGSRPFDGGGKKSDYDLTVESNKLVDAAKDAGIDMRNGGRRTGPIERDRDLEKVGLKDLHKELTDMTGGRPDDQVLIYIDGTISVDGIAGLQTPAGVIELLRAR